MRTYFRIQTGTTLDDDWDIWFDGITLNKKKADGKEVLAIGDEVQFFFSDETFWKFRGNAILQNNCEKRKEKDGLKSIAKISERNSGSGKQKNIHFLPQYESAYEKLKGIEIIFET